MADDERRRFSRRGFFRNGFRELLRPVVDQLDEKLVELGKLVPEMKPEGPKPAAAPTRTPFELTLLRPPGARPEAEFLATCSRCGACVNACPVSAIVINDRVAGGAPHINADVAACALCHDLACMSVCPTEALVPTPMRFIDMGTARWNAHTCLRTANAQDCTICVDVCPVGEVAIRLDGNHVQVIEDGCTGCGLCQQNCPTNPKSIAVEPVALRR